MNNHQGAPRDVAVNPAVALDGHGIEFGTDRRIVGWALRWGAAPAGAKDLAPDGEVVYEGPVFDFPSLAPVGLSAAAAAAHYEAIPQRVADVRVGRNSVGLLAAGRLRPDVDREPLRGATFAADLRRDDGLPLRVVAVLLVRPGDNPVRKALACPRCQVGRLVTARLHEPSTFSCGHLDYRADLTSRPIGYSPSTGFAAPWPDPGPAVTANPDTEP